MPLQYFWRILRGTISKEQNHAWQLWCFRRHNAILQQYIICRRTGCACGVRNTYFCMCDNNMCVCVPELLSLCVEDKLSMVWCHTFLDSYYTHIVHLDKTWPESYKIGRWWHAVVRIYSCEIKNYDATVFCYIKSSHAMVYLYINIIKKYLWNDKDNVEPYSTKEIFWHAYYVDFFVNISVSIIRLQSSRSNWLM
jgi:hypothetical protein